LPFLAVSFFCGLRRAEALRLDWSAVDLQESFVKLPAAITKKRQTRYIELSENCRAWLNTRAQHVGRVMPNSPDVLRKRLSRLKTQHQVHTIKHGPRHCFASYWLAEHGDINQLCRFIGDEPETTFKHYAKAATKREAEKYWAIMPTSANQRNIVAFKRTSRRER
jgi:integrase